MAISAALKEAAIAWLYSPAILIPGLHLAIAQLQLVGQLHAILHAEILLPLKGFLQRLQLMIGEGGARLALLLAQAQAEVRVSAVAATAATASAAVLQTVVAVVVLAACVEWREKRKR